MKYTKELAMAIDLAEQAGVIQQKYQATQLSPEYKADHSPVTIVDRRCEERIRSGLLNAFPRDGFIGEESGTIEGTSGRRWIVDPLDGTRPFIRGIPTYSTLIGLEDHGIPVVGVIHLPALKQTCWAGKGHGAFNNGTPIHVSTTPTLRKAMGSALGFIEHDSENLRKRLLSCMRTWNYAYGFMDAFSYACCAGGKLDLCVNLLDKPWDCGAAACIIVEAGGRFSDLEGNESIHNGSIVLSNGLLHRQVLDFFTEGPV